MGGHSTADRRGVVVVPASPADRTVVARVLAAAFSSDAHTLGLLPTGPTGTRLTRLFARMTAETFDAGGHVYLAVDAESGGTADDAPALPLGAALWEPPGRTTPARSLLRGTPTYVRVFGRRLGDALRTEWSMERHRPGIPHWYLKAIGTPPGARGRGAGAALLAHGLARADADGIGTYLESSTPANLPLYRRFGFVERGRVPAPGTVPPIAMWRPSAGSAQPGPAPA